MQSTNLAYSDEETEKEVKLAVECNLTESDREEAGNPLSNEGKGKWRIDFGF